MMWARIWLFFLTLGAMLFAPALSAERVDEARIRDEVIAPYSLGPQTDIDGVWELLNGSGLQEGYVIETEPLAPLPGFGGSIINMMVMLDLEGVIIDVKLLSHNEPIFVSGLGEQPFRAFLEQYRGTSINTPMTVGTNYGADGGGALVFLDGVTKATASVRIAHESILAATREVAKQKLQGFAEASRSVAPNLDYQEELDWEALVEGGIAQRFTAAHGEVRALFADTIWRDDDLFADRADDELFADLWVVDIGPPAIAKAALAPRMLADLERLRAIAPDDEPLLLIEAGDHGLVSDEFVRNTSPPLITAKQDGLPIVLRDADLLIDLKSDLPEGRAMVVRVDRRLGFDPAREWQIGLLAVREHGMFQPEIGQMELEWSYAAPERFFIIHEAPKPRPPWLAAINERGADIALLALFLGIVLLSLGFQKRLARASWFQSYRVALLAICLGFIGWWGQGQLSIVTPLAVLNAVIEGKSLSFLLYDPFSLLIWIVVIVSFLIWGRALFCGWLCPFGAFQELIARAARKVGIKELRLSDQADRRLKLLKYVVLIALIATVLLRPDMTDKAAEVEPFKTAISVFFVREWFYVAYAVLMLAISAFLFKGFCRYLCPLGALMSIGGWLRLRPFIERRVECGSPCQLCRVKCSYQAIEKTGKIDYRECFGCLDCVEIYESDQKCVPLIIAAKQKARANDHA